MGLDLSQARVSPKDRESEIADATKEARAVLNEKPPYNRPLIVHPTLVADLWCLKVGVGTAEEFAIVLSGEAVDAYRSRLTIRTFFPAMTSDGICYLWNINAASESSWCKSARKAASIAKRSPITYWAISSKKRYGIADAESSEALTDPQWPLDTIEDFVEAAYESDMLITSLDHDLVKGFRPELAEDE